MNLSIQRLLVVVLVGLAIVASVHYTIGRIWMLDSAPATQAPHEMIERQQAPATSISPPSAPQIPPPVAEEANSFRAEAGKFAWDELASTPGDVILEARAYSKFIFDLSHFASKQPLVEIEDKCREPPALPDMNSIDCYSFSNAFTGKRAKPAKIAHMIQFGFEVDVLEIHLRELYDVVDVFFILESTRAHKELVEKPLIWERIKDQERFEIFADKIVHIILDDIDASDSPRGQSESDIWYLENMQESVRFQKFLEWNQKQAQPFTDQDMIGFGDADEVAWRNNIHLLKHCVPKGPAIDIGIWFPMGRVDHAFRTDWPVAGHPYSLGDPTFFTLEGARARMDSGKPPSRNRGSSGPYLLGGMHMTRHRYLPFIMLESLTCSECGHWDPASVQRYKNMLTTGSIREAEKYWDKLHSDPFVARVVPLERLGQEAELLQKIPWFLSCNRYRYPYWWGEHDTRLGS